jgi:nucleotide-binding universal stress UspA family protein
MQMILLPTDFSENARNAAEYAASLARYTQAQLILFYAYHVPAGTGTFPRLLPTVEEMAGKYRTQLFLLANELWSKYLIKVDYRIQAGTVYDGMMYYRPW